MKKIVILLLAAFMVAFVGCKKNDPEPIDEADQTENQGSTNNTTSEELYVVKFSANGATGTAPASLNVKKGTSITLPKQGALSYEGHFFEGWKENNVDSYDIYEANETYTVYDNTTFYAYWKLDESLLPNASFSYYADDAYKVTFHNYSTKATSYQWDFGDGSTSTQTSPEHRYPEIVYDKYYNVKLKATNSYGTDTWETSVAVRPRGYIELTSTSDNPYEIYLDGVYQFDMPGNSVDWITDLNPGEYRVRVLQKSGYLFTPTDKTFLRNLKAGEYVTVTFP